MGHARQKVEAKPWRTVLSQAEARPALGRPHWGDGRAVLFGDAAFAVFLFAGRGATLAMAGAVVLADALENQAGGRSEDTFAAYEARLRPWVEAAQWMARRNAHLLTPSNRSQSLARGVLLRMAARPFLAPVVRRLLNREGERLGSS